MVPAGREEEAALISQYLAAFAAIDKRELTPEMIDLYVRTVCDHKPKFELRQIEKGLKLYLETENKWPWPADLISIIEDEI